MAANIKDRAYTFSFSFGPDQMEKIEGEFAKRQYRHTNPSKYNKRKKRK